VLRIELTLYKATELQLHKVRKRNKQRKDELVNNVTKGKQQKPK